MEVLEFLRRQAARGGKAAAKLLTAKERSERARKGGLAGGRGRPKGAKKAAAASAKVRTAKARAKKGA